MNEEFKALGESRLVWRTQSNTFTRIDESNLCFGSFVTTDLTHYIISNIEYEALLENKKFIHKSAKYQGDKDQVVNFVHSKFNNFQQEGGFIIIIDKDLNGYMKINFSRENFTLNVQGTKDYVDEMYNLFNTLYEPSSSYIDWVYNDQGGSMRLPIKRKPLIRSAYPYISGDIESYIDDYINGPSSILLLLGEPGTGKTTFISELIYQSKQSATLTYDEKVMSQDGFFASFMDSDDVNLLIMEDADSFIRSRTEGNMLMHKFLNVSDGLIANPKKKLIFSTNLASIEDVDSALIRPGRCHDVIKFRKLDRNESLTVLTEVNKEPILPSDAHNFTLAEILVSQQNAGSIKRNKMGF